MAATDRPRRPSSNTYQEEEEALKYYIELINYTIYIVIGYGAWSAFVGLMGMITFIANFINKYTCIFNGKTSRIILTAMFARKVMQ